MTTTKIHCVKINPFFYYELSTGAKTFEIRKDDRDYRVGDILTFTDPTGKEGYPGAWVITFKLTSRLFPEGLKDGYCLLSLKPLNLDRERKDL